MANAAPINRAILVLLNFMSGLSSWLHETLMRVD
jgi:hypothetical protein